MKGEIVETRERVRPRKIRITSIPYAIGALIVLLGITGCDEGPRIVGAQQEFEEQVDRARENAKEREAAHRHAVPIQRAMHPRLRTARHPTADCNVEYPSIRPQEGIEPIACGNLAGVWPLTVKWGYLRCEPSIRTNFERVVFTAPDGTEYAVNASAHGVGYVGITPIWKRGKEGTKVDIEPLRDRGLALCEGNL